MGNPVNSKPLTKSGEGNVNDKKFGWFIAVVGSSGVGKDTLLEALRPYTQELNLSLVTRHITREDTSAEDSTYVPIHEFDPANYVLSWQAHGYTYGLPKTVRQEIASGKLVLANLSRKLIAEAEAAFDQVAVLSITVDPQIQARRLAARGRETTQEIGERLARQLPVTTTKARLIEVDNSGPLEKTVTVLITHLRALKRQG